MKSRVLFKERRGPIQSVTRCICAYLLPQEYFNCSFRSGKYYLSAEPSVECYDFSSWNQHTTMLPICIAGMVVYVLGIPMLFGSLLYRNRKVRTPLADLDL